MDRSPVPDADVCVVGVGPAGGIVAHRLAESGAPVVILEAGPRFGGNGREQSEQHIRPGLGGPWEIGDPRDAFSSSGDSFYPLNAARVKGVGGSTLHWQGMVMRLHERDFELGSRHGVGADWPIGYDDLRPYYAAAECELGAVGATDNPYAPPREEPHPFPAFRPSHSDSTFAAVCERLGIDMHLVGNARNSESYDGRSSCVGYGTCKPVYPSGMKYTAESHVEKAEAAGARVIGRARVRRLDHDETSERVVATAYTTPDSETHRREATQFALACGGVGDVRLLLLSDPNRYPDGLANSSGAVGRYFMDHLFAGAGGRLDRPTRQNHVGSNTNGYHQFYDDAEPVNDLKLEFLNYAGPSPVIDALHANTWGDDLCDQLNESYGTHISMGALVEQLPCEDNYVGLDRAMTDDLGDPVPEIHWSVDEQTKAALSRANGIQTCVLDELGIEDRWTVGPDEIGSAYHHMGTTRMGDDPDESVVDVECRAHDLDNLWISESSVFPTGGAVNPTLTIAALSVRLAESLRATLG